MLKRVSIILVNYNGKKYLEDFMKSAYAQSYSNIEIVLVDNASKDDSAQWIKANYPEVKIIRMEKNEGFGEGCNIGIDYAINEGTDYILLLNTDTILDKNLVEELVENIDDNMVITATIYKGDKSNKEFWYAGGRIDYETAKVDQLLYIDGKKKSYNVDFISGCCMMFHRDIIEKVGNFDRRFYLYYEDVDFCMRLRQHGINMKYITTTSLWHKVGGSSIGGNEMSCSSQYYVTRNRLLFTEKYPNFFKQGNLDILRQILQEYAFFDGAGNDQYAVYVRAAISDYLKGKFENGFYGKVLLEEHFYAHDGLGERETDGEKFWYCAKDARASISIVNSQKKNAIYKVTFDIASVNGLEDDVLIIEVEGCEIGKYKATKHVEVRMFLRAEQSKKINVVSSKGCKESIYNYDMKKYFQLLNLKVEKQSDFFYMDNNFMPEESNGQHSWYWSTKAEGSIYLVNDEEVLAVKEVAFEIVPYEAREGKCAVIYQDEVRIAQVETGKRIYLRVMLPPRRVSKIEIRTDFPIYEEEGEKKCFKVHNLSVSQMEKEYYMGNEFLPEERNEKNIWSWSSQQTGTIYLVNDKDALVAEEVTFDIVPYDVEKEKGAVIYQDEIEMEQIETGGHICLWVTIPPRSVSKLGINTEFQVRKVEEVKLCFGIYNLTVTELGKGVKYDRSFYLPENNGKNIWRWCREQKAEIQFILEEERDVLLSFKISTDHRYIGETIKISIDGKQKLDSYYNKTIYIPVKYDANIRIHKMLIEVNHLPYKVDGDDRWFTFQLLDYLLQDVEKSKNM